MRVESIVHDKVLLSVYNQRSGGYLVLAAMEDGQLFKKSPLQARGQLHIDGSGDQIWVPHLSDQLFRRFKLSNLTSLASWRHEKLSKPWQINVTLKYIAANNLGENNILIFNRKTEEHCSTVQRVVLRRYFWRFLCINIL